jgi:hypothetical protein
MAARIILVEAWPRRIADGVAEPVRLAGGGSAKPYRYNNQRWLAGIAALPTIIAGLSFDGDNLGAGAIPQALEFSWASTRASDLTNLASGYLWPDAAVTIRVGPEGALPPVVLTGKVVDASSADGQLRIVLADPAAALRLPVLTERFAGTDGLEGPEEWKGRIKRRAWGRVWNVEGEPINPANNIYCFADPRRPIASIDTVRDSGAPAAALTSIAWQGTADATWAALLAAVAPQGGGVVAPSIACVKWWTEPAGTLTADLRGEISTGYVETAPEIAARLVETRNGPPFVAGAIVAAKALRPAPCGVLVERDTETVAAVLDTLLGGVSLIWRLDAAGSIDFRTWAWGAPVASVRSHQITRRNTFKPVKSRKIGYRANQTMMSRGDIAGIVFASDISFADGSSLPAALITYADGNNAEALKPYEPNATAGALIPDPSTYVPGDPHPGYIRDSAGSVRSPGELLNSEIELEAGGRLTYRPLPGVPPVELGRITPQGLGVVTEAAFRRAEDDIDQMARALATALGEASSTRATFRDAGFYVDAATGQIRIHAIEQTRERVNTAEIRLNAAEASINLRATTSYVNEAIALAVIDPSQIAELTDIFLRLGAAEVDIDGLNATVTTLATVTELSLVQGRVTAAETAIDALEGTITSKVDTTTFDLLATRVTNAETVLTAIGDTASIVNAVSATRLIEKAQDANAESDLRTLLQGDRTKREQVAAIASAQQELTARIIDGDAAEAALRLALQVRVGATEASLATESIVRASADAALATQITQLTASTTTNFNSLTASIANETSARTTAINAEADARIAAINAEAAARGTAITAEETARINAINAERTQTLADVAAEAAARAAAVSTLNASITAEQTARTNADTALATSITNLSASLTSNVATLQTNINNANQARIDGDGALAASISSLSAELDTEVSNRAAAVESEAQARVAADGLIAAGLAQQVTAGRVVEGQASELADLLLGALLNNDKNRREVNGAVAGARQEITAQIVSEVEALSTRILALVARVAGNEASIVEESLARVTAVESLASTITSLNASFTGALSAEATARTNAIAAEASTRATAIAAESTARTNSVNTLTSGLNNALGRLDDEELARLQGDQAEATARAAALTAEANARIAAINAEAAARGTALTAEENARIAAINAEIAAREAAVTTLTASISNEAIARANADGALAGQISTLNTTVAGQSATLTTFGESINGLRARWGARIDVNGRVTGFVLNGDADETDAVFVVDNFKVVDPDTGNAFLDADADGLRLQNGKVVMNNGTNMLVMGAGFGVDNQFVMWFGPSRAISACNEADALFYLDVTGDGVYGLRLGSNYYKNSGTGTSIASNAQILVGPFTTDGGVKQINVGFQYRRLVQITDAFAYTGTPQAIVRVERQVGSGGFTTVGDYTFNGTASGEDGFGPGEPGSALIQINGGASFTDSTGGTGDFTYRVSLISRSVGGLTSTVSLEDSLSQQITLISTEQIT